MINEVRKIMDFIMGGCMGFCFFYGGFLATSIGVLMVLSFIINVYKVRLLNQIDADVKIDLEQDKKENKK